MASVYDGEYQPGEDVQTDEEIAEWLRENVRSDWHVVGTAAMRESRRYTFMRLKRKTDWLVGPFSS